MTQKFYLGLSLAMVLTVGKLYAQETNPQPQQEEDLYEVSLEELMNIPINSASKKDETLFDAPLSSYTITRAEIDRAGSTSIMEALRLAPGVIVREQTNGVYDIHIRGFDNILRTSLQPFAKGNLATLVMIDNRPVFNHNLGGTFWEALPIDINDVERIEIVRGPSAPLFGPNAVTGVINIITKRADKSTFASATVQYGSPNTLIANGSFGLHVSDHLNFGVSVNHQKRDRFDDTYYHIPSDEFLTRDELAVLFPAAKDRFPNPEQAMNKWGANGFLNFAPTDKISLDVAFGTQAADVQKVFLGIQTGITPITYFTANEIESSYINLSTKLHGFHLRGSIISGSDDVNKNYAPGQYDYVNSEFAAEYAIQLKNLSITPGVSFQRAQYTDEDYIETSTGFLNGKQDIETLAAFVRLDYNITDNWRLLAAARGDKFSSPDVSRLSYEIATTYNVDENNLIRAAVTRSNSGSFIGNNYLNVVQSTPVPGVYGKQSGNQELELFTVTAFEIGYRTKFSKSAQLDIDLFRQEAENFSAILLTEFAPTPPFPQFTPLVYQFQDLPTTAVQYGLTVSFNLVPNDRIQFKPFVTWQTTDTNDIPDGANNFVSPDLAPVTYTSGKHKNTPSFYGGYYLNLKASEIFTFNLNGYYYAEHNQYDVIDKHGEGELGATTGKLIFNAKINAAVSKHLNLFLNARNLFNSDSREFFGTDQIGGLYIVGASFNLN